MDLICPDCGAKNLIVMRRTVELVAYVSACEITDFDGEKSIDVTIDEEEEGKTITTFFECLDCGEFLGWKHPNEDKQLVKNKIDLKRWIEDHCRQE